MTEPTPTVDVARILGLQRRPEALDPMEYIKQLEDGLKPETVARFVRAITPDSSELAYLLIPKATLARRVRDHKKLTTDESARVVRAAKIWDHAVRIWKSRDTAREFLLRPHPMLAGRKPIEVAIATEVGAAYVDNLLGGIEFSTAP